MDVVNAKTISILKLHYLEIIFNEGKSIKCKFDCFINNSCFINAKRSFEQYPFMVLSSQVICRTSINIVSSLSAFGKKLQVNIE